MEESKLCELFDLRLFICCCFFCSGCLPSFIHRCDVCFFLFCPYFLVLKILICVEQTTKPTEVRKAEVLRTEIIKLTYLGFSKCDPDPITSLIRYYRLSNRRENS